MRTDRILELADVIERQPEYHSPHRRGESGFTMSRYVHHADCGSPACIAGWAVHKYVPRRYWNQDLVASYAREALGLDLVTAKDLFVPRSLAAHVQASPGSSRYISPQRAARTLRYLACTGHVDWDAPDGIDVGEEVAAAPQVSGRRYREGIQA